MCFSALSHCIYWIYSTSCLLALRKAARGSIPPLRPRGGSPGGLPERWPRCRIPRRVSRACVFRARLVSRACVFPPGPCVFRACVFPPGPCVFRACVFPPGPCVFRACVFREWRTGLDPRVPHARRGSIRNTRQGARSRGAPAWGSIRDSEPAKGVDPGVPQARSGSIRNTRGKGLDPRGARHGGRSAIASPRRGSIRASYRREGARSATLAARGSIRPWRTRRRGHREGTP